MNNRSRTYVDQVGGTTPALPPQDNRPRWFRRTWVLAVAAGILGFLIGTAAGVAAADVTASPEYAAMVAERDEAQASAESLERRLADAQAELEEVVGDLPAREAAAEKAEAEVEKAQQELEVRRAAVKQAEAAVAKREKTVGLVEREIAANTIPGDGVFEVGVDMKAGTYKSSGSPDCYYAVLGDANGNDIRSNNITSGPTTVSVTNGRFFETQGCAEWVLQR